MTLRRKILLIIGVTLVALIVGLYKVSSFDPAEGFYATRAA